jgi:type II secretory pathway pseudopilin PulG
MTSVKEDSMRNVLKKWKARNPRQLSAGVSLLEMLISMSLATVLMASLVSLYFNAAKGAAADRNRSSAEAASRFAVERVSRDFKLVGLLANADVNGDTNDIRRDVPNQTWSDSLRSDFEYANTYEVVFTAAVDNDSTTQTIRMYRDARTNTIREQVWKWKRDSVRWSAPITRTVASDADYLMFKYYDRNGATIPNPVTYPVNGYTLSAGERVRITAVEITLVTHSASASAGRTPSISLPDGKTWSDRYQRKLERVLVRGRNLSLGA